MPEHVHIGADDVNAEFYGARWHHSNGFDFVWGGAISDIRIYELALLPAQVLCLQEQQLGRAPTFSHIGGMSDATVDDLLVFSDAPPLPGHSFTLMATIQMSDSASTRPWSRECLGEIMGWSNKPETVGREWKAREFRVSRDGYLCYGQIVRGDWRCVTDDKVRLNDGRLHCVAVTKSSAEIALYVDGVLAKQ